MTSDMPLWISDSGCTTAAIYAGTAAAREVLAARGVTAQLAYDASLARADGQGFDARHADAWDAAERAALSAADAGERAMLVAG